MTSSIERRDVAVPILVACVRAEDILPMPPTAMRPDADVAALAAGAAADIRELRRMVERQNALLRACAVQPNGGK